MTIIKGVLIPADDAQPVKTVELDRDDYQSFQNIVGGYFQVIDVPRIDASLYMDEEGKMKGLPLNKRATELLYAHRNEFVGYDTIVGDALVLGPADQHGNTLSCPSSLIERLSQ